MFNGEMRNDKIMKGLYSIKLTSSTQLLNLGKIYLSSADQPIEFNSQLDDKSRFQNVEHFNVIDFNMLLFFSEGRNDQHKPRRCKFVFISKSIL